MYRKLPSPPLTKKPEDSGIEIGSRAAKLKAMTFSDTVNEGAVEFHKEQCVRAFRMGKTLPALKVRVRFNKKCWRAVHSASAILCTGGNLNRMALKSCFASQIDLVTVSDAILTGRQTRLEITVFVWKSNVKKFS